MGDVSRRKFLGGVAVGSGAAAVALPGYGVARSSEPPFPVTTENYPWRDPGKSAAVDRFKIVTQLEVPPGVRQKILAFSPGIELKCCNSAGQFQQELADAHVIYGMFQRQDLARASQLRWIQWRAAGVENIMWPELVQSPIVLTNMQRKFGRPISETVFALLLGLTRGINQYTLQAQQGAWKPLHQLVEISGMTMGVVGLGGNGSDTAYRAHYGFNMRVLAVDPKPLPKPWFVEELHPLDWFPQMIPQVDVLVSAAPLTPISRKMFNEQVFRAMKPAAYFINISRGKLVDTPALVSALRERQVAGAGLDVTDPEPLPADHPLWTAGNIIITCHSSGFSPHTLPRCHELFAENVRRYVQGLPLMNVVDKARGY
jgi:phosphoglycerate dehydrogenase-like enzyme